MTQHSSPSSMMVLVPAYNEAARIAAVLQSIARVLSHARCVVIDDGSRDATGQVARDHGAIVLRHPFNLGYGVALQTGYKYALQHHADLVLQIDADGQHDPEFLAAMAEKVRSGQADVVIGSRFYPGSPYKAPFFRRLGITLFNSIVRWVTGQKVTDCTSGFQALDRKVLPFYASDLYPWDFPDADVLLMLHYARFRVAEMPVVMHPSPRGKSMHGGLIKPFYYVTKMMLSILVTVLRGPRGIY